jgi:exonuclease III
MAIRRGNPLIGNGLAPWSQHVFVSATLAQLTGMSLLIMCVWWGCNHGSPSQDTASDAESSRMTDTTPDTDDILADSKGRGDGGKVEADTSSVELTETLDDDASQADSTVGIGSMSIYAWNLWDNGLSPDNLALVQGWNPDMIFFEDLTKKERFDVGMNTLGTSFGHDASDDGFALISHVAFDEQEMIYDAQISKQLFTASFSLGDTLVTAFQLHNKNPTHQDSDRLIHQQDMNRILEIVEERTSHEKTILLGDFNSRSPKDGATEYIYAIETVLAHGYIDTFKKIHPSPEAFMASKIARSFEGARIDYVFVSADLEGMIIDAGIEDNLTYPEHSDHRPVWARMRVTASE